MARELVLILSDFFLRDTEAPDPTCASGVLPRLPALEAILAEAHREQRVGGWRRSAAQRFGEPGLAALAPAAVGALAWLGAPPEPQRRVWFATPVHYFAGLDSLRLHPSGLLPLSSEQRVLLATDFERVFADSPWHLHAGSGRELLLSGPLLDADGEDPARFLGADPSGGLPRGAQAATLRRLAVEMEMWLHEHPLNQERLARRELPVNGLWLWGARPFAAASEPSVSAHPPRLGLASARLFGHDSYLEALWELSGRGASLPVPARFEDMAVENDASSESQVQVVLHPLQDPHGLNAALQGLEERWLVPALAALRARELQSLELLVGDRRHRVRRWHLSRWRPRQLWRKRAPWWEGLH